MQEKQHSNIPNKRNRSILAFENALFSLMEEVPCNKISISNIIEKSGYSRTAFYANFVDKDDFIEKTVQAEITQHVHLMHYSIKNYQNDLFDGMIYRPILALFQHVYEHRPFYHVLFAGKISNWDFERFASECNTYFLQTIKVSCPQFPNMNLDIYYYIETLRFINFIMYWDRKDFCYSPEYMAAQVGIQIKLQNEGLLHTIHFSD